MRDRPGRNKLLHRNFKTRQHEKLFEQLEPYGCEVVLGCESTFNWYWLCDACEEWKIPFLLGHALHLKAIHGGKVKSDKLDSEKLARLLRGGNFAVSYAYPSQWRATRDLLRRRSHFVSRLGETLAHLQIVNHQQNLPAFPKRYLAGFSFQTRTNSVRISLLTLARSSPISI